MSRGYRSRLLPLALLALGMTRALSAKPVTGEAGKSLNREFQAALAAYQAGHYTEAAVQLKHLLPSAAKSFEVHELLGLTYAAQSNGAGALEQLKLAVDLKPDSVAARSNLATALIHAGKTGEAEVECRKALALAPEDYNANHNLAEMYIASSRIAEAVPLLEEAKRVRPDAYDNSYDLALTYLLTGQMKEARERTEALVAQRETGEAHTLLGRIDEREGRFLEAANEFGSAAHRDPSEDNLFAWASELLLHRTYEPAIEVFTQATERYPKSPRLWIGLGMALYSRGEYDKSIHSLLTAADLNPADPRCYLFLSKAYLSSPNQADDVIARFRRYAELEPGNAMALYYYAVSLWKGKRIEDPHVDYAAVEALLKKSVVLDGTNPNAHLQLGILYIEQHRYAEALPEYERALQLNPNLPDAHYRLGQYYVHAGEKTKAQSEFDQYQRLHAEHQAEIDKERAAVQQFVVSTAPGTAASAQTNMP